jgi:hypothetical protein
MVMKVMIAVVRQVEACLLGSLVIQAARELGIVATKCLADTSLVAA